MDAVIIGIFHISIDFDFIHGDVVAVVNPVRPAGGLVDHGDIFHFDIFASGEEDCAGRCQSIIIPVIFPTIAGIFIGEYKSFSVAVNGSHTGQRDVLAFLCKKETGVSPAG